MGQQLIFYTFSTILLFAGLMVVIGRNAVRSALFLVLAFFASAGLWILLEMEFLALVLVLVYVGAVMTLFLFVVMTLNLSADPGRQGFVRYLPYGILVVSLLVAGMVYVISPQRFSSSALVGVTSHPADYSNVKALGEVLYTEYAYPFEISGVLLLVAIIAAISLSFRGRRNSKYQAPGEQVVVRREERVKLIKMKAEKKPW